MKSSKINLSFSSFLEYSYSDKIFQDLFQDLFQRIKIKIRKIEDIRITKSIIISNHISRYKSISLKSIESE